MWEAAAALQLVRHLAVAQAEDLEASGVGGQDSAPTHEPVEPAGRRHRLGPRLDGQVVAVANQGLDPCGPRDPRVHALQHRPGGDAEEPRGLHRAVVGPDHPTPGGAVAGRDTELEHVGYSRVLWCLTLCHQRLLFA